MNIVAEYVSEGHVDRLCDAICENIVDLAVSKDKDSLVGVEAAIHRDKVFVDGRIACGFPKCLVSENEIIEQVKKAYEEAGYNKEWNPSSEQLEIISDIILDPLNDDERQFRNYSDDQNIVNGYATNIKAANYLPVEHFLVAFIGKEFNKRRKEKI